MRREVEALLAYEEQTESFLETPAVFGFSQGVTEGVIFTAVEQRYRAVVLMAGGLWLPDKDALAEVNHVNFAPYIQAPKLMLNGRYDEVHPLATLIEPAFGLLREPKKLVLYDGKPYAAD